jgi:hypothetical protein
MESELLPTDTEDAEVVSKANQILEIITHNSMSPFDYVRANIVELNQKENEYTELVTTSRAKQLELTEKYSALAEKYYLLSDKYSDLMDKHITLKEQHELIRSN